MKDLLNVLAHLGNSESSVSKFCLVPAVQTVSHVALQSIWAVLGENGVPLKTLVAVLSFFILAGKAKSASVEQRVNGLHAASVYLLLLGIPGETGKHVSRSVYPQLTDGEHFINDSLCCSLQEASPTGFSVTF